MSSARVRRDSPLRLAGGALSPTISALWKTQIDYLGDDAHTKSIRGYLETLGGGANLSVRRAGGHVAQAVAIKAGRTPEAARGARRTPDR